MIKVERPVTGDDERAHKPTVAGDGATFALLNRTKRSVAIDLKDTDAAALLIPLIACMDVAVEQFRRGVMDRLGFGYERLRQINPRLIYCSITGYGSTGPPMRRVVSRAHPRTSEVHEAKRETRIFVAANHGCMSLLTEGDLSPPAAI